MAEESTASSDNTTILVLKSQHTWQTYGSTNWQNGHTVSSAQVGANPNNTFIWELTPQSNGNYRLRNTAQNKWSDATLGEVELEFQGSYTYNTLAAGSSVEVKIKSKSTSVRQYNGQSNFTLYNPYNEYLVTDDASWGGSVYWQDMRTSSYTYQIYTLVFLR